MSEKRLWLSLKGKSAATWKRIENMVGPGTPDVVGTLHGQTAFVELKAGIDLKVAATTMGISHVALIKRERNMGRVHETAVYWGVLEYPEANTR